MKDYGGQKDSRGIWVARLDVGYIIHFEAVFTKIGKSGPSFFGYRWYYFQNDVFKRVCGSLSKVAP
jgi:hypothetical protein